MPQPGMGFNGMPATSQPGFNMEGSPAQMGYIQTANKPLDMEMPMQQQPPQQPPQQMLPPNQNAFHLHSKSDDVGLKVQQKTFPGLFLLSSQK